ncbi:alpha/beta hydrolase [Nocardia nova]|uniref:alpha/beta hydrolase n=1 Tax=Nocardia nova TaxID=37330 RepID=UPI00340FF147
MTTVPERRDVSFFVRGVECAAWWYLPDGADELPRGAPLGEGHGLPVVVLGHGLGGVRAWRLDEFARAFQDAGYACLAFDYRGFGDSDGTPRQVVDPSMLLEDWRAAVGYARSRPEVDPNRVVLFGTSFGGGHVTQIAAEDPRIAAVIAQCPFLDGLASARTTDPVRLVRLQWSAARDLLAARRGADPVLVDIGGPRGSGALVQADEHDFAAMVPAGDTSDTRVAARIALSIMPYRPGRSTAHIACPALFLLCERDRLIPINSSKRHASRAPKGEVHVLPYGHFDIYDGAPFRDVLARELEFVQRVVPVGPADPSAGRA